MSLCGTHKQQTTEDGATQPMEAGGWVSQLYIVEDVLWTKKFSLRK